MVCIQNKAYRRISIEADRLAVFLLILSMIYPSGILNAYVPFALIGMAFLSIVLMNGSRISCRCSFLVFTVWIFVSSLLMSGFVNGMGALRAVRSSIGFFIPFFALQIGRRIKTLGKERFLRGIFFLIFAECIMGVIQVAALPGAKLLYALYRSDGAEYFMSVGWLRANGTFGNPNAFGVGICVLTAIYIGLEKNKKKIYFSFLLLLICIIVSKSRTAIVVSGIVLFSYFIYKDGKLKNRLKNTLLAILALAVLYLVYAVFTNRAISIDALSYRAVNWNQRLTILKNYPGIRKAATILFGEGIPFVRSSGVVDNEYLFVFLSSGLLGVLIWISSIIEIAVFIIRSKSSNIKKTGYTLLSIWLISGITAEFYGAYKISVWVFLVFGMITAKQGSVIVERKRNVDFYSEKYAGKIGSVL